jgi:hypothetical protein
VNSTSALPSSPLGRFTDAFLERVALDRDAEGPGRCEDEGQRPADPDADHGQAGSGRSRQRGDDHAAGELRTESLGDRRGGAGHPVLGAAVSVGGEAGAVLSGRHQHVAGVQHQPDLHDEQEQEDQQDRDQRELDDGGAAFLGLDVGLASACVSAALSPACRNGVGLRVGRARRRVAGSTSPERTTVVDRP